MADSLSVVLPVHNAQRALTRRVELLLDTLAELTSEIELLIVDDGSTDETEEIGTELARGYPQIHFVRNARPLGTSAAAQVGMKHTCGSVVMIHDIESDLSNEALRKSWASRRKQGAARRPGKSAHLSEVAKRRCDALEMQTPRRASTQQTPFQVTQFDATCTRASRKDLATYVLALPPTFSYPVHATPH